MAPSSTRPAVLSSCRAATSDRAVTSIEAGDGVAAVLVHDRATLRAPGLADSVAAAVRLALDNVELESQIRARLRDVEASRARLLAARDSELRNLETRLRAGVEPRLERAAQALAGLERNPEPLGQGASGRPAPRPRGARAVRRRAAPGRPRHGRTAARARRARRSGACARGPDGRVWAARGGRRAGGVVRLLGGARERRQARGGRPRDDRCRAVRRPAARHGRRRRSRRRRRGRGPRPARPRRARRGGRREPRGRRAARRRDAAAGIGCRRGSGRDASAVGADRDRRRRGRASVWRPPMPRGGRPGSRSRAIRRRVSRSASSPDGPWSPPASRCRAAARAPSAGCSPRAAAPGWRPVWRRPAPASAPLFTLGLVAVMLAPAPIGWAMLLEAGDRLRRPDRVVVAALWLALGGLLGLLPALAYDPAAAGCAECPANLLGLADAPATVDAASRAGVRLGLVALAACIALGALAARPRLAGAPPARVADPAARMRLPRARRGATRARLGAWPHRQRPHRAGALDRAGGGADRRRRGRRPGARASAAAPLASRPARSRAGRGPAARRPARRARRAARRPRTRAPASQFGRLDRCSRPHTDAAARGRDDAAGPRRRARRASLPPPRPARRCARRRRDRAQRPTRARPRAPAGPASTAARAPAPLARRRHRRQRGRTAAARARPPRRRPATARRVHVRGRARPQPSQRPSSTAASSRPSARYSTPWKSCASWRTASIPSP